MIIDFNSCEDGARFEADLCIVGGGMSGLTIARSLLGTRLRILVVETGGLVRDPRVEALNPIINEAPTALDVVSTRPRVLGGSTALWGSFLTPLDASDFVARPGLPLYGWPFTIAALEPYYRRAHAVFGLGPECFDERLWPLFGATPPAFDPTRLHVKFWQLSSPRLFPLVSPKRFGTLYRAELAGAEQLRVLLNANAVAIATTEGRGHVTEIALRSLDGRTARVAAHTFVLAAGAIENARLLLNAELGGDNVGRFFMEHPHTRVGMVAPKDPRRFLATWAVRRRRGTVALQPALCPTAAFQAEQDILNGSVSVEIDRHPDCPTLAFSSLAKALLARKRPPQLARNLWRIVRDPSTFATNAYRRIAHGSGVIPRVAALVLFCRSEQEPNPLSRITLDRECDALGLRRARLDWRLSERDRRTVVALAELLRREFARLDIGAVAPLPWLAEQTGWPDELGTGPHQHHTGTARMADDPRHGVVDSNSRMHGIDNLYVAGPAVFPTSGYANPGLTTVAMALRLADRLQDVVPAP
jgi:choline dehydrogenase-like flavoprotein